MPHRGSHRRARTSCGRSSKSLVARPCGPARSARQHRTPHDWPSRWPSSCVSRDLWIHRRLLRSRSRTIRRLAGRGRAALGTDAAVRTRFELAGAAVQRLRDCPPGTGPRRTFSGRRRFGRRDGDRDGRERVAGRADRVDPGTGRSGRIARDLSRHGARRRRRSEPTVRPQQARQGCRGRPDLAPRRSAGDGDPGRGRSGGPRARRRSGGARHPRPTPAPRWSRPRTRARPDPAGEGRRRPDRAVDGATRARPAGSRRMHPARRDAAARTLRRADQRQDAPS